MADIYRLDGKTAVVTAAAHGIGRATAIAFGEAGAKVVCSDIDSDAVEATALAINDAGGQAIAFTADVGELDQMQALAAQAVDSYGGSAPQTHISCQQSVAESPAISTARRRTPETVPRPHPAPRSRTGKQCQKGEDPHRRKTPA